MTHITTEMLKARIVYLEWAEKNGPTRFVNRDLTELLRELLQRREADRWIPTSEALPGADVGYVLAYVEENDGVPRVPGEK